MWIQEKDKIKLDIDSKYSPKEKKNGKVKLEGFRQVIRERIEGLS